MCVLSIRRDLFIKEEKQTGYVMNMKEKKICIVLGLEKSLQLKLKS